MDFDDIKVSNNATDQRDSMRKISLIKSSLFDIQNLIIVPSSPYTLLNAK